MFALFDKEPEENLLRIRRQPSLLSLNIRNDYIYICQSLIDNINKTAEMEYTKIINSLREGYYFSDLNGNPYNGGNEIMIRVKIPIEEDSD
jgi:hypothetical protein